MKLGREVLWVALDNAYLFVAVTYVAVAVRDWSALTPSGWGTLAVAVIFAQSWFYQRIERQYRRNLQEAEHIMRLQDLAIRASLEARRKP